MFLSNMNYDQQYLKNYYTKRNYSNLEVDGTVSDYAKDVVTLLGLIGIVAIVSFLITL